MDIILNTIHPVIAFAAKNKLVLKFKRYPVTPELDILLAVPGNTYESIQKKNLSSIYGRGPKANCGFI